MANSFPLNTYMCNKAILFKYIIRSAHVCHQPRYVDMEIFYPTSVSLTFQVFVKSFLNCLIILHHYTFP